MKSITTTLFPLVILLLVATQQSVAQQYSALDTEVEIIPGIQEKRYFNIGKIGEHTYSYTSKGAILGKKAVNLKFFIHKHDHNMEVIESKEVVLPTKKVTYFWIPNAKIRANHIDINLGYVDKETGSYIVRILRFDPESFEEVSDTKILNLLSSPRKSKKGIPPIDYISCKNGRDEFGLQYYDHSEEEFNVIILNNEIEIELRKKYTEDQNYSTPHFSEFTAGDNYFSLIGIQTSLSDYSDKSGSILYYKRDEKEIINIPIEGVSKQINLTSYIVSKTEENTFLVAGLYQAKAASELDEAGYFSYTFNANNGDLTNESYQAFPMKELSEKQLAKRARKKNPPKLMSSKKLYARNLFINEDGTVNLICEYYTVRVKTTTSSNGSTRTVYIHIFGNLTLVNIDNTGTITDNFTFEKKYESNDMSGGDGNYLICNSPDFIRIVYLTRELELGLIKKNKVLCVAKIQKSDGSSEREQLVDLTDEYSGHSYAPIWAKETGSGSNKYVVPLNKMIAANSKEIHITFK